MRKGFDKQLSKWIARLPFSSLRARLLLLLIIAFLPAYSSVLCSAIAARQQAAEKARDDARRLSRLMAMERKNLIERPHSLCKKSPSLNPQRRTGHRPDWGVICS